MLLVNIYICVKRGLFDFSQRRAKKLDEKHSSHAWPPARGSVSFLQRQRGLNLTRYTFARMDLISRADEGRENEGMEVIWTAVLSACDANRRDKNRWDRERGTCAAAVCRNTRPLEPFLAASVQLSSRVWHGNRRIKAPQMQRIH